MIRAAVIAAAIALSACGHAKDDDAEPYRPSAAVSEAHAASLAKLPAGWPSGTDCDGLLWSGLARAAGHDVDLLLARADDGRWHRRQVSDGPCFADGVDYGSKSSISRDMFVGLLAGLMAAGGDADIQATLDYAAAHDGIMGEGDWSRIKWTTNIYGLFERALGNSGRPIFLFPVAADYENHLQMVEIVIYRRAAGDLPIHIKKRAAELALAFPSDALAQAMACFTAIGRCAEAEALALDPDYQAPSYVRGPAAAFDIHRAYAAQVLLYTQGE